MPKNAPKDLCPECLLKNPSAGNSQWLQLAERLFGIQFTSPAAIKLGNISALGCLGALGFLGAVAPSMQPFYAFFGLSGFFGLIGIAFIVEFAARRRAKPGKT